MRGLGGGIWVVLRHFRDNNRPPFYIEVTVAMLSGGGGGGGRLKPQALTTGGCGLTAATHGTATSSKPETLRTLTLASQP